MPQPIEQTNEYTDAEISEVVASAISALAETMGTEDKISVAKAKADETKAQAYESVHNLFESFGLDREAKATDYRQNGAYAEVARDICTGLSKKLKDPVAASKRGDPMFSMRVKKAWSRLVVAYREAREDTQSEADKAAKATMAKTNKTNKIKASLFDVLVGALRDPETTAETIEVIHGRFTSTAEDIEARE